MGAESHISATVDLNEVNTLHDTKSFSSSHSGDRLNSPQDLKDLLSSWSMKYVIIIKMQIVNL